MDNRFKICFEILKNIGNDLDNIEQKYKQEIDDAKSIIAKMFGGYKNKEEESTEKLESIFYILNDISNKDVDAKTEKYYNEEYTNKNGKDREGLLKEYSEYCKNIENYDKKDIQNMLNKLKEYTSFIPINKENIPPYVSVYQYYKNLCLIVENRSHNDKKLDKQSLYGIDLSGIQSFIYTIHTSGALKMLRARSFYLEILMENIIDQILEEIELTRINLIYSGAGHAYLLLPDDKEIDEKIKNYETDLRKWCREKFGTDICIFIEKISIDIQKDIQKDTQKDTQEIDVFEKSFMELAKKLQVRKKSKYNTDEIKKLNEKIYNLNDSTGGNEEGTRECAVCLTEIDNSTKSKDEDGILRCEICESLHNLSNKLIAYKEEKGKSNNEGVKPSNDDEEDKLNNKINNKIKDVELLLPNDEKLIFSGNNEIITVKKGNEDVRLYYVNDTKSNEDDIYNVSIYLGNYAKNDKFEDFIKKYEENSDNETSGINRIGVLRADVDNLGKAFVGGFDKKYKNLVIGAELSSKLAFFFKYYINKILENPEFKIPGNTRDCSKNTPDNTSECSKNASDNNRDCSRNISIIYAGGDDVFVVGEFLDIIEFAIDIREKFNEFSNGKLTLSAGIGLFNHKYPLVYMADETGKLEEFAKKNGTEGNKTKENKTKGENKGKEKDSVALFSGDNVYNWEEFWRKTTNEKGESKNTVINEKYEEINKFFANKEGDKGNTFLYNILQYLEKIRSEDSIYIARLVYLLGKLEPEKNKKDNEEHSDIQKNIYKWAKNSEDRKQLITAIRIYIYKNRKGDKKGANDNGK